MDLHFNAQQQQFVTKTLTTTVHIRSTNSCSHDYGRHLCMKRGYKQTSRMW